eukprot:m.473141 g.473141  ORF g.473141 m.473141 type:complete len:204 (+) comp21664_c0_seq18:221-832(+)
MRRSRQVCCGLSTITGTVIGFLLGAIFFLRVDVQEKARRMQIQFTELERVLESETRCRENIRATELSIIDLRERLSEKEANSPTNPKTNAGESVLETCRLQIEIEQADIDLLRDLREELIDEVRAKQYQDYMHPSLRRAHSYLTRQPLEAADGMSTDDARNAVIVALSRRGVATVAALQNMSDDTMATLAKDYFSVHISPDLL